MSHRRIARVVLGQIESLESRRMLDSGDAWLNGSWNGVGITSSNANTSQFGIGYAEASDVLTGFQFPGTVIDQSGVLLRYTRYGDADLDGTVNLEDFNRLAANFGQSSAAWNRADFSYDGMVNLQDFNRLAANFGISASGTNVTPADWAALAAAVNPNNLNPNAPAPQVPQVKYAVTNDGTLRVTGTKANDHILVDAATLANMRAQHPEVRIKRVHVDAGAGNDRVEMQVALPATLIGGKGDDHINAGARADHISGGAGVDVVNAGSGNDTVEGLAGTDILNGGPGADLLLGGDERDDLFGGSGDDTMRGGAGDDYCVAHDGNDLMYGDAGRDYLYGGGGHDRFKCLDGEADTAYAGRPGARDRMLGGDPDDKLEPGGF